MSVYVQFAEWREDYVEDRTYLARLEVETSGIKVKRLCEIGNAHSEMTEFVHWRGAFYRLVQRSVNTEELLVCSLTLLESLGFVAWPVFLRRLDGNQRRETETQCHSQRTYKIEIKLRQLLLLGMGGLSINKVEGEIIDRVVERDAAATTRCISQFVDLSRSRKLLRSNKIGLGLHDEGCATEYIFFALSRAVHKWFGAGAAIVDILAHALDFLEPEVQQELMGFVNVFMGVEDVCDADQVDPGMVVRDGHPCDVGYVRVGLEGYLQMGEVQDQTSTVISSSEEATSNTVTDP